MRNYFILLSLSFIGLISCNDDSATYSIGEDFIDLETRVLQIDSLTLKTSTIISDSLVTSGSNRLLIGSIQDSKFGDLTSQSFLKLTTNEFYISNNAEYDSIALILNYDTYYYGDTTQIQSYKVHEIIETFKPNEGNEFYNTSSLDFKSDILGELSFKAYPNKKDSIHIPLKHDFGYNLFYNIKENNINNTDDLEQVFRGVTVIPDNNNNNVLGFSNNSVIRIFYTNKDEDNEDNDYYIDFIIEQQFNKITSDKSTTLLNPITDSEYLLSSSETNNNLYMQSGTGISMRVEIPYIRDLNSLENNGTTLNATLKMFPVKNSYNENISLTESLSVFVVDHKNRFIKQLLGFDGQPILALLNSNNDEFESDIYYSVDLSSFIEEVQSLNYNTKYALVFLLPNSNNTVDKLLINDSQSLETKMKLELTYMLY